MKYSDKTTQELTGYLRNASNRTDACTLTGISYETFTVWMKKTEFSEAVQRAEAECKQRNITIVQRAAIKSWQAAGWWLERKHQNEYALKNRVEHSGHIAPMPIRFVQAGEVIDGTPQEKLEDHSGNGTDPSTNGSHP